MLLYDAILVTLAAFVVWCAIYYRWQDALKHTRMYQGDLDT
jgi:hypothetical protein